MTPIGDRPHPNNAHYREILQNFETEALDNQDKKDVQQFLSTVFKEVVAPLFDPKLPELMKIDHTDPFLKFSCVPIPAVSLHQLFGPCEEK